MNYVILKEFLSKNDCNVLINNTRYFDISEPLGLLDGNDYTNIWYKSSRSHGLEYRYQKDAQTMSLQKGIKKELTSITGIDFSGGINELCLPFCKYPDEAIIKAHRDIDKVSGLKKPVEYVIICMLTQSNKDFNVDGNRELPEDGLFINIDRGEKETEDYNLVSKDGKVVHREIKDNRLYPNLNKGDVIIFRNDNSIHGVDTIRVKEGQIGRITCGFRSK